MHGSDTIIYSLNRGLLERIAINLVTSFHQDRNFYDLLQREATAVKFLGTGLILDIASSGLSLLEYCPKRFEAIHLLIRKLQLLDSACTLGDLTGSEQNETNKKKLSFDSGY